jgi:hypothetical protein
LPGAEGRPSPTDPQWCVYACFTKCTDENTRATLAIFMSPHLPLVGPARTAGRDWNSRRRYERGRISSHAPSICSVPADYRTRVQRREDR